jgi:hypothetical protein
MPMTDSYCYPRAVSPTPRAFPDIAAMRALLMSHPPETRTPTSLHNRFGNCDESKDETIDHLRKEGVFFCKGNHSYSVFFVVERCKSMYFIVFDDLKRIRASENLQKRQRIAPESNRLENCISPEREIRNFPLQMPSSSRNESFEDDNDFVPVLQLETGKQPSRRLRIPTLKQWNPSSTGDDASSNGVRPVSAAAKTPSSLHNHHHHRAKSNSDSSRLEVTAPPGSSTLRGATHSKFLSVYSA